MDQNYPTPTFPSAPPANIDLPALLEAVLKAKVTKERQYFLNQRINLDGQRFIECRFDGCTFYTETGDIYLQDCVFGSGNIVIFGVMLKKVVQLVSLLDPTNISPQLFAEVKQKGTVQTISII
jgi:hypothetical protein